MKIHKILVLTPLCSALFYCDSRSSEIRLAFIFAQSELCYSRTESCLMSAVFPMAKEYKISAKDTTMPVVMTTWVAYDTVGKIIGMAGFKSVIPDTVWSVFDSSGNKTGIVFRIFPRGYGGPIETFVGLGIDTTVTGIRPATPTEGLKETPGLGTKINELWFRYQFIGKREANVILKKDGGRLDAITAATISCRAVADGVRKGINKYKKYL